MNSALVTALVLAQAAYAPGALVIESDSSCPSAAAVREALVGLRPAEDLPSATVSITTQGQALLLSLGPRAATPRRLAVEGDCGARAATVALVIAAWLSELPAEVVAAPTLGTPEPVAHVETATPAPSPGRAAEAFHRREVGAGLVAETGSGLAPGLRLDLLGLLGEGTFGWQVGVVLPAERDVTVGPGSTRFRRTSAVVSLLGRKAAGRLILSADAGAAVAYTSAHGTGYQENQTDGSVTYGPMAGLRAGIPWGRVRVWVDGRLFKWLYGQTVEVEGVAATAALPSWDLQWALGAAYAF
jgi:hypothetical protein